MSKVLNFEGFLNEAVYKIDSEEIWPRDWKSLPQWAELEKLGFEDVTPDKIRETGNIVLSNIEIPEYPAGIVLQQSGYIRDRAATSGFIKRYTGSYSLAGMFDYLIKRFSKLQSAAQKETSGTDKISPSTARLLDKITVPGHKSWSWRVNNKGKVDVQGAISMVGLAKIPEDLIFGKIDGNFSCNRCGLKTLENFGPEEVTGIFNCDHNQLSSFDGFPKKIGSGNISINNNNFTSLEGLAKIKSIKLKFLNVDNNNLKTLVGSPSLSLGISCDSNYLENLDGISTTGLINVRNNPLKTLSGIKECSRLVTSYFDVENLENPKSFFELLLSADEINFQDPDQQHWMYRSPNYSVQIIKQKGFKKRVIELAVNSLKPQDLDQFYSRNPHLIYQLDSLPKLKKEVISRTGIKDVGGAYQLTRLGLF